MFLPLHTFLEKYPQESISPTFYTRIYANILVPIKSLTFTASTKKLCANLFYEKATHKMLVKMSPERNPTNIFLYFFSA
jgi:hypothetical protein